MRFERSTHGSSSVGGPQMSAVVAVVATAIGVPIVVQLALVLAEPTRGIRGSIVALNGGVTVAVISVTAWRRRREGAPGFVDPLLILMAALTIFTFGRWSVEAALGDFYWRGFVSSDGVTKASALVSLTIVALTVGAGIARRDQVHGARPPDARRSGLRAWLGGLAFVVGSYGVYVLSRPEPALQFLLSGRASNDFALSESASFAAGALGGFVLLVGQAAWLWRRGEFVWGWSTLLVLAAVSPLLTSVVLKGGRLLLLQMLAAAATGIIVAGPRRGVRGEASRQQWSMSLGGRIVLVALAVMLVAALPVLSYTRVGQEVDAPYAALVEQSLLGGDLVSGEALAVVASQVPESIAYAPLATVRDVVLLPIPRLFWDEKPILRSQELSRDLYGSNFAIARAGATYSLTGIIYSDGGIVAVVGYSIVIGYLLAFCWLRRHVADASGRGWFVFVLPAVALAIARDGPAATVALLVWAALTAAVELLWSRLSLGVRDSA